MNPITTLLLIVIIGVLLILMTRRVHSGWAIKLRPLAAFNNLGKQTNRAIESRSQVHISLGQANLTSTQSATSVAALSVLDYLAEDGCANQAAPLITVGDGTLLVAAQGSLRHAFNKTGHTGDLQQALVQFVASEENPLTYASGVTTTLHQNKIVNNVIMGKVGPEVVFMTTAGDRENIHNVVGTDDLTALAVAQAISEETVIGEELFAAGAYLQGEPNQIASVIMQDILRVGIIIIMLAAAILQLI